MGRPNKYAKKPTVSAAELAAWNARTEQQKLQKKGKQWHWRITASNDGMELVSPNDKVQSLQWAEDIHGKFVKVGTTTLSVAYVRSPTERAETIVNRIVDYLNKGVVS